MIFDAMPQYRQDPISGHWVIIAPERGRRPIETVSLPGPESGGAYCPFCEGHEHETPHEIAVVRAPGTAADSSGWSVRVVPNRFPAVKSPLPSREINHPDGFLSRPGIGIHEVVIESPTHTSDFAELDVPQIARVLALYRERLQTHRQNRNLVYVQMFKNQGARAGASLEHVHSQILGMPFVPERVQNELNGLKRYREEHGGCAFCGLIESELAQGERVIQRTDGFVAVSAYAGRFAHEMWVLPLEHGRCIGECDRLDELAELLRSLLLRLELVAARPDYNLVLHVAPNDAIIDFHWHIEILPRINEAAGFEWGTNVSINPILPEESTARMRAV